MEQEGQHTEEDAAMDATEEEEEEYIGARAFGISGELHPDSGPPTDGFSYLQHVRWEARRVPKVVRSNIDPRQYDSLQTIFLSLPPAIAECPEALKPSAEWESAFLHNFDAFRKDLAHRYETLPKPQLSQPLPAMTDAQRWKQLNLGVRRAGKESMVAVPAKPTMSVIMNLDLVSIRQLLDHHIRWAQKANQIDEVHMSWLFALLSRLDSPIDADMASSLRALLRRLALDRSTLDGPQDPSLPGFNILITIISKYFGQGGS